MRASHAAVSPGMKSSVGMQRAISERISCSVPTHPAARACNIMLPTAVASEGPAVTGIPSESAVN